MSFESLKPGSEKYRTVFLSDIHLGTRGSRADFVVDFLNRVSCDKLYLVGDIIDGWQLRRSWYWDSHHDEILRLVLSMARRGVEIIYIPGNHDEMLRAWLPMGLEIASIQLRAQDEHVAADGKRYLVTHGDEFDSVVRYARFLALLGDRAYTVALVLNRWLNLARRRMGLPYRSFSAWAKKQVKAAVKAIDRFEIALAQEARKRGMDGVICGHIHNPEIRDIDGCAYMNTGDWVESCTALVEHEDGHFELIDWAERNRLSFLTPSGVSAPVRKRNRARATAFPSPDLVAQLVASTAQPEEAHSCHNAEPTPA